MWNNISSTKKPKMVTLYFTNHTVSYLQWSCKLGCISNFYRQQVTYPTPTKGYDNTLSKKQVTNIISSFTNF